MHRVDKTAQAERDLEEIWFHIALDNPAAADKLLEAVDRRCRMLTRQPMMGRARPELAPELRSLAVMRYVLFYAPTADGIMVVRVVHGARDIASLVDGEGFEP